MPLTLTLLTLLLAACAAPPPAAPPAIDISAVPARMAPSPLPEGWQHGAFMEIFVRAYQDSDGDGIGDLRGLISRLDYLQDLGIKGLWLMPITASADRDHGYAATDFRAIERDYGTLADFDELIKQAHARGIGVIIDYVINHSAAAHPMFVQARQGPSNPWRDWFVWSHAAPQGWDIWGKNPWYWVGGVDGAAAGSASAARPATAPWDFKGEAKDLPAPPPGALNHYFGTFGPQMPDFNLRKPEVLNYHLDSLRFWLNRGLDGFRLDAVPHMIETDAKNWNDQPESRRLTKQLQDLITAYPRRYVVCEATAEPQVYGRPEVCGGAFAFGYVHHFVEAARGKAESVAQLARYYQQASSRMATFVSSHDIFAGQRLWDQLGGDVARYRLAAAAYLLQPGTPFIYYGEEVGQAGVPGLKGDFPLRAPMSWTPEPQRAGFMPGPTGGPGGSATPGTAATPATPAARALEAAKPFRPLAPNLALHNAQVQATLPSDHPSAILPFYKAMLKLRNGLPAIARGSFEHSFADGAVLGFQRLWQGQRVLVLINFDTSARRLRVADLPAQAQLHSAYPENAASSRVGADGAAELSLAPQSLRVFTVAAP